MILVDPRDGSRQLLQAIKFYGKRYGIPASLSKDEMPAGDFAMEGLGPNGTCLIGVERKTVRDMLSSIRTGRFAGHQLRWMTEMYQFRYLILEGIFRSGLDGIIEEPRHHKWMPLTIHGRNFMYQELMGALMTYEQMADIRVYRSGNEDETAALTVSIYRWWNSKEYSRHRAHAVCNAGHVEIFGKWPLKRRVAKEFYKIGSEKSKLVSVHFKSQSTRDMVNADESQWAKIPGIGKVLAKKIVAELNEI